MKSDPTLLEQLEHVASRQIPVPPDGVQPDADDSGLWLDQIYPLSICSRGRTVMRELQDCGVPVERGIGIRLPPSSLKAVRVASKKNGNRPILNTDADTPIVLGLIDFGPEEGIGRLRKHPQRDAAEIDRLGKLRGLT